MHERLKLRHRRHSGRLRPHEYTSYPPLFILLLIVGFALTVVSVSASTPYNGPESGAVALSGTMPGPPPSQPATISNPTDGQHFTSSPIAVTGTCPKDSLVELYKNDIFAGSSACKDSGSYSFDVDLLIGKNTLIARDYNALNEAGPDSKSVIVYYDYTPPLSANLIPINLTGAQLLLNTDAVYRGVFPGQPMTMPIDIIGGTSPFAVNIEWGDGSNKIIPRGDNLTFNASHTYQKAGTFQITIQATDSQQRVAFLTVAAIVNGQPAVPPVAGGTSSGGTSSKLLVLWPLYAISATMVISFWFGERREKHILNGPHYTSPTGVI